MISGPLPIPRRLLIMACSATKRPDPAPIPARDRYDGPLWRTLRATDPRGRRARVGFLSARYGFRDAQTPIEDYDARLSEDLAARMIAGGMTTRWPRPPSPRRPDSYGMHPGLLRGICCTVRALLTPVFCPQTSQCTVADRAASRTSGAPNFAARKERKSALYLVGARQNRLPRSPAPPVAGAILDPAHSATVRPSCLQQKKAGGKDA
jgi:hypothetical protein